MSKTTTAKKSTASKKSASKKAPAKKVQAAKKAPAKKVPQKKAASKVSLATGKSTVQNPVLVMWNLCNDMQDKRRKDVIEAAVAKGVSYYTARTQYQLWLTAFRNS